MAMPKSCTNVWWTGFMSLEMSVDMSYPNQYRCDIHIDTQNALYRYLNITVTVNNLVERYRDGTCEDHVQLYSDQRQTRPLTPRLCGTGVHSVLIDQSNFVLVIIGNGGWAGAAFSLQYESYARSYDVSVDDDDKHASGADGRHMATSAVTGHLIGEPPCLRFYYLAPHRGRARYCNAHVCLFQCLCVCLSVFVRNFTQNFKV